MYMDCGAILDQSGYEQYEVSNYALPGRACRHNRGYWLGRDYLGLGPSAVSCMDGTRRTNSADIMAWSRSAGQGGAAEMEALSPRERNEEFVMLRLRMAEGFAFSEYAERTGRDLRHTEAEFLGQLEREGLADCGGGRLRLTRRGMLLSNSIISRLFGGAEEHA